MRHILFYVSAIILLASQAYCQDTQQLLGQVAKLYGSSETAGSNLIGGFSLSGLIGGILFGSIGFIVFIYGKKNCGFKPMIIGVLLMGYPYFIRSTIALYLIGVALIVALFVFRE